MDPKMSHYEHFTLSRPGEYIAVVEINRASKLNAFIESYVCIPALVIPVSAFLSPSLVHELGKSIMEGIELIYSQNVARSS